jgi:hypothetical protein
VSTFARNKLKCLSILVLVLIFLLLIKISVGHDFGEMVWSSIVCVAWRSRIWIPVGGDFNISIHIQPPLHWTTWVNGWTLIMDKTNIVKFSSEHDQDKTFLINYQNNSRKGSTKITFLGLELDKHINWKNHINKILPKCFVVKSLHSSSNMSILKMIYSAYFLVTIILWGNSIGSNKVFLQQRRISRIITFSSSRTSYKPYFRDKNY